MTHFEDVFSICGSSILKNLNLNEIKNIRLVSKSLLIECNNYIRENRRVKFHIVAEDDSRIYEPISWDGVKSTELSLSVERMRNPVFVIPNQWVNISKLLLTVWVSAAFQSLDVFFSQLPNLNYFGFLCTFFDDRMSPPNWWETNYHPNLRELEILKSSNDYFLALSDDHFDPLCRFIRRQNIHTLRAELSLLKKISHNLIDNNVSFINLYLHWDDYISLHDESNPYEELFFIESASYYLRPWYRANLYQNLFLEAAEGAGGDDNLRGSDYVTPGLKELRCLKLKHPPEMKFIRISETETIVISVVYEKSKWFHLRL